MLNRSVSRSAVLAIGACAAVATATTVIPAMADGTSPANPAPSFVASAPCSGKASVSLTWAKGDKAADDTLISKLWDGSPGAKWTVQLADYSGDTGSVGEGTMHANDNGRWRTTMHAGRDHHRFELLATSAAGQVCAVTIEGQMRPLN